MSTKKSLGLTRRSLKRSLGQNFLRDEKILKKIVDFARIEKTDTVVEVGPGEGTLTKLLLERAKKVIAVEKDERMVEFLQQKFKQEIKEDKLQIINGDILKLSKDVFEMPRSQKTPFDNFMLIGNIPYYITGALFKKFLETKNQPGSMNFVVQREVAERIIAKDGRESILSISIKAYGKPEFGGIIKAGSFHPVPKVDSAVIAVRNINRNRFEIAQQKSFSSKSPRVSPQSGARISSQNFSAEHITQQFEKRFFEILKAGFAHKRKLLIKNLNDRKVSRTGLDTVGMREIFKKCGIPEKARAENLSVDDWVCLTRGLM